MNNTHYKERLFTRFINKTNLKVGYEIKGTFGEYVPVGTYTIPEHIKSEIIKTTNLVETHVFSPNKSYGVKIASFDIDKSKIVFINDECRFDSAGKDIVFLDSETQSNGNEIYLIIRNCEIKTIFFAKNYVAQNEKKMRVDFIINNINTYKN